MGCRWLFPPSDPKCEEPANGTGNKDGFQPRGDANREHRIYQPKVSKAQVFGQSQQLVVVHDYVVEPVLPLQISLEDIITVYGERISAIELLRLRTDPHR